MLLRVIIAVYSENRTEPIKVLYGERAEIMKVKADGSWSKHFALKD
jgi:hypothetical protein